MKTAFYGRIVFGASAVLFGVIALKWHDVYTWQSLHTILSLPFGATIGECLMAIQIAGGIALASPGSARLGSIVLGVLYVLFSLACIPAIIAAPKTFDPYDGFFEQFSLLCGAAAAYAVTGADGTRSAALGRAARIGFGFSTISFTLAQVLYLHDTASLVPSWIPPNQTFWAIVTTIAFALAAIAILINVRARLALRLLTLMLGLFGVLVWIPLLVARPATHFSWSEFALTALITGAAWMVAELRSF
jgi:hypothetical protein